MCMFAGVGGRLDCGRGGVVGERRMEVRRLVLV